MEVSVENTSNLGRKITISIPDAEISKAVEEKINKLSKNIKLDGFRPGKVPLKLIKTRYEASARHEVINDLMSKNLFQALSEQKIIPAGRPTIENIKDEPGKPLEYEVTLEVYPQIQLQDFSAMQVQKTIVEIKPEDVDKMIENIRSQYTIWEKVEREAQNGDRLVIDFEGFINEEPLPNGKGNNVKLILGSNSFISGFEAGLLGAKNDETRELQLKFPEEYHVKDLAGKPVTFKVKVSQVCEPILPELNDEFVKKMGIEDGGLEGLKQQIKEHMSRELERMLKQKLKNEIFDNLVNNHNFEIPQALLEKEEEDLHHQMHAHEANDKHHEHETHEHNHPELAPLAKRRVCLGLIVGEIIKQYQIKPEPEKVRQVIENLARSYQHPEDVIRWYYGQKEKLEEIENIVLEDQVIEKVLEKAQITEKKSAYFDEMNH